MEATRVQVYHLEMEVESCVPPGFRFHPTEEELVGYYLTRKVASLKIDIEVIADVDLYRIEPWDLQDRCKYGHEDRNEWYFFSHKDKKYPTGTRTNRATTAGFWKATGRDKAVVSKSNIIGMRKTLVFYEGRAPNGRKSDWIMHEYRLQTTEHGPPQEEGWVVCRAFRKPTPSQRQPFHSWNNPAYYIRGNEQMRLMPAPIDIKQKTHFVNSHLEGDYYHEQLLINCEQELESKQVHLGHLFELPHLNSPSGLPVTKECCDDHHIASAAFEEHDGKKYDSGGQFIDWKALDKLLGAQVNESTSSSNSNLPPIMLDYEADVQNHGDHFFTLFSS